MVLPRHECIPSQACLPVDSTLSPYRLASPSSSACLPRLAGPPRPQIRCPRTLNCPPCQLPTSAPRVSAPHAYLSLRWSMTTGPCTQQHCLPEPSAAAPARTNPPPRPPPSGAAPARARLTPLKRRTTLCQSIQHHPFPGIHRREPHQRVPEPPPLPRPSPSGAAPARARTLPRPWAPSGAAPARARPRQRTPAPAAPPARNPVTRQFRSLKPRH